MLHLTMIKHGFLANQNAPIFHPISRSISQVDLIYQINISYQFQFDLIWLIMYKEQSPRGKSHVQMYSQFNSLLFTLWKRTAETRLGENKIQLFPHEKITLLWVNFFLVLMPVIPSHQRPETITKTFPEQQEHVCRGN